MTVATTTRKAILAGNGVNTNFGFNFAVRAAADLQVYYTDANGVQTLLAANLYSVALSPVPNGQLWAQGGSVTYPLAGAAIAAGTSLTIARNVPLTQTSTLINQGGYSPQTVEQALDLLDMAMQQLNEIIARSLTIPISSSASTAMPVPAANALLGWDPTGTMIINVAAAGAIPLPLSPAQGGTGAANTSAKGSLLLGNAGTYAALVVGANNQLLVADSTQALGVKWSAILSGLTLVSPSFTGVPTAPTAAQDTNSGQVATTSYVLGQSASKADQQSPSSNARFVSPLHQQDHPSALKGWALVKNDGTVPASYNVTSVTRGGAGNYTVNWITAFATANYCPVATAVATPAGTSASTLVAMIANALATGTTQVYLIRMSDFASADGNFFTIQAAGAQ